MKSKHQEPVAHPDPLWVEHGYGTRFQGFQNLMRRRIRDVLIVSSLYDLYVFEEDGRLYELIRNEYQGLNLSHAPEMTRVSSGRDAIALAKEERRFDLIITTMHIEDMPAHMFAKLVRESDLDIPIVLLAYNNRELADLVIHQDASLFTNIFIWQGDFRLLIAIIKQIEDQLNVDHDTRIVGVQSIILVEDNIRYYSSFLPIIYVEILKHSQRLISEGINLSHKYLRMRARPKILLCKNYEEAWTAFEKYKETVLGIISDIDFPRNGKNDPDAGLIFAREVRNELQDIPILLQSNQPENEARAEGSGASFLLKDSATLLHELRQFMIENFSFGDFIFRTPEGYEVARATDLTSLEEHLRAVPEECVKYHAERNHFSNWLKARTEFWLAHQLRPRKVSDFPTIEALRDDLISSLQLYRRIRQRGIITDFRKESFDPASSFARIGGGSIGGKARGLSFVNMLINNYNVQNQYEGVHIAIPPTVVIGTDIFDEFLDENELRNFALNESDDNKIIEAFLHARTFPEEVLGELAAFLDLIRSPLAVRSSSLLEDSQYHPFAGVYKTYMIPNNHPDPFMRLAEVIKAIKRVYASTFFQGAKEYIKVTSYRLEEEKMAVIVQQMVGGHHGKLFYPDFSGVAKSHNFYPIPPQRASDGTVSVALGLGKMVVDGGVTVRFSPKYPEHVPQFASMKETLKNNQRDFYALDLMQRDVETIEAEDYFVKRFPIEIAERDGTLATVGSTYSPQNECIYDGIGREGIRLVTFAPVLKNHIFPLAEVCELLLDMGSWGMGTPVEIEIAVNLSPQPGKPKEFGLLQMRPLVLNRESEELVLDDVPHEKLLCVSNHVLGHGIIDDVRDVVVVNKDTYERGESRTVAREVSHFNAKLVAEGRPYLLVGVGRWGSMDPWLGIPVAWNQISGARTIIEASFKDFDVEPSQGSHFFHNLTSFQVGYFSVSYMNSNDLIDWDWLLAAPYEEELGTTRHLRLDAPLIVRMDGHQSKGIIVKPDSTRHENI